MPDPNGFITEAESYQLEKEADALLRADAEDRGFIRENGRGYSEYARTSGMTTKKTLETTYKHEKVGFEEHQLESLGGQHGDPAAWVEMKEDLEHRMDNVVDRSVTTEDVQETL